MSSPYVNTFLLIVIVILLIKSRDSKLEHLTPPDVVTLKKLSGMYKSGIFTVNELKVNKKAVIGAVAIGALNEKDKNKACIGHKDEIKKDGNNKYGNKPLRLFGQINYDRDWALRPSSSGNIYLGSHTKDFKPKSWFNTQWVHGEGDIYSPTLIRTKGNLTVKGNAKIHKNLTIKVKLIYPLINYKNNATIHGKLTAKNGFHHTGSLHLYNKNVGSCSGNQVDNSNYDNKIFYYT